MSNVKTLTPDQFDVYKLVDPRINFDIERKYFTSQGATNISVVTYQPMSATSSDLSFSVTTMGPTAVICKKAYVLYTVSLQDSNPATGNYQAQNNSQATLSDNEGIRPYCLTASSTSLSVSINGQNNSWSPAETMIKMATYNNQNIVLAESGFPLMTPQFMANPGNGAANLSRSENAPYEQQFAPQNMMTNNVFNYSAVVRDASAGNPLTVQFTVCEPVICSPFDYGSTVDNAPGLVGVNKLTIQYSGIIPARFWSSQMYDYITAPIIPPAPPAPGTFRFRNMVPTPQNLAVGLPQKGLFVGTPLLVLMSFTVPSFLPFPPKVSYPIFETNMYKTSTATVLPGTTAVLTSNTIPLKCIPCRFYVWAGQNIGQEAGSTPLAPYGAGLNSCAFNEATAAISSVNLTFGNKTGLLSGCDPYTLYQISRKNGCGLNFTQFTGAAYSGGNPGSFNTTNLALVERPGIGAVLCFTPEDLGVEACTGCIDSTQLIVQVTVYNQSVSGTAQSGIGNGLRVSENHSYILYVVIINDGLLTVDTTNYTWSKTIAPISKYEARDAPMINNNSHWKPFKNMFGGNLFDGAKKGLKTIFKL